MVMPRTAWADDSGSGSDGTILNNAEKTALYDQIDARWSEVGISSTGAINNLSITEGDVARFDNATIAILSGIVAPASPPKPGKRLYLYSAAAGDVEILNESGLSTAANRFITGFNGPIRLAAGIGRAVAIYDDLTNDRWRIIHHEQGQAIGYTPIWTASGVAPALGNGTLAGAYYVRGKQVSVHITFTAGSTTTFGTGVYSFTLPFVGSAAVAGSFPAYILDAGTNNYIGVGTQSTTTTIAIAVPAGLVGQTIPMTWANGDILIVSGTYYVP